MADTDKTVLKVKGEDLLKKVKDLIQDGKATRLIITSDCGQTYLEIPLALGIVGAALAPVLAAVGALAALVSNVNIEVVRKADAKPPEGQCCCCDAKPDDAAQE